MAAGEEHQGTPREHSQTSHAEDTPDPERLAVVGIGASAGGIRALHTFFHAIPPNAGIVFVVVMHLAPERESTLPQVLQTSTAMPVRQVKERVRMELDHVYVIPPNQHLRMADGHLEVSDVAEPRWQRAPIDIFFRTLAEVHPDGIGILFSGSGSDGTVGLQAIKECGGIAMVQLPEEAEFDAMPRSAIATGLIDFVLPAAELAAKVVELRHSGIPARGQADPEALPESDTAILRRIVAQLQAITGHDFSGYKPSTVLRRIERRMRVTQVETHAAYLEYVRSTPHEAQALLKDLLISVTHFFRDPAAFDTLQVQVIPKLFADKAPGEGIRVWVAGCATGEEAYSIAMLLLEHAETVKNGPAIQVFASDPDEDALAYGRRGLYPSAIAADVSEARLQRFLCKKGLIPRCAKNSGTWSSLRRTTSSRTRPFRSSTSSRAAAFSSIFNGSCKTKSSSCSITPYNLRATSFWVAPKASKVRAASSTRWIRRTASTAVCPHRITRCACRTYPSARRCSGERSGPVPAWSVRSKRPPMPNSTGRRWRPTRRRACSWMQTPRSSTSRRRQTGTCTLLPARRA